MKKLVMMLAVMSLLIGVAAYGKTNPTSAAAKKNREEAARIAEEKGDLDRLHKDYDRPFPTTNSAVRINTVIALIFITRWALPSCN